MVLVNRDVGSPGTPVVAADYQTALTELLELLYGYGHRSLVFLAGASAERVERPATLAAVSDVPRRPPRRVRRDVACGVTFADGYDAVAQVRDSAATGVLAFNDLVAMGLMSGLHERGVRVPDEISVVGFDDIPFARYLDPAADHGVGPGGGARRARLAADARPAAAAPPERPRSSCSRGSSAAAARDRSRPGWAHRR